MTNNYTQLLKSRNNYDPVKGKVLSKFEWEPYECLNLPLMQPNCKPFIEKAVALGLVLEIEVGEFIKECLKDYKDLFDKDAKQLLLSNVRDEGVHFNAFKELERVIDISDDVKIKAENIASIWTGSTEEALMKARCLEAGVFLVGLACLARVGSQSTYGLAFAISKDEYRHVATNYFALKDLGIDIYNKELANLIGDTLKWLFTDTVVAIKDRTYTTDDFIQMGMSMLKYGESKELQEFSSHGLDVAPFEVSNKVLEQIIY